MPLFVRVHARAGRAGGGVERVIAVCDEELLGRVFEEGEARLDLLTYRSFYEGERVNEAQAVALIKGAENLNLVGPKALAAAGKALDFDAASVKRVKGVPHLQVYKL